jgi:hypothetical protein
MRAHITKFDQGNKLEDPDIVAKHRGDANRVLLQKDKASPTGHADRTYTL